MGSVPTESEVLSAAKRYIENGLAVHWLHRRAKNPVGENWQNAPVHTFESLKAAYRSGYNIGIRPGEHSLTPAGYLHLIDLDIRKPELADEAWACLLKHWPEARNAPYVISGSGGESRHIYLITDRPFRSVTFGKSEGREMVFDPKKGRDVQKWDWECGLYGAPKQAVLPPSVHPDTGENYVWGREIEWDLLDMGIGPIVSSEIVGSWGAQEDDLSLEDDDDLMALARSAPMGLSEKEIDRILADIPNEDLHHDDYVQVGMALHHEYEGSQIGFEKWCEWAKQSDKFDVRTQKTKWKSFKETKRSVVRMATLIKVAGDNRLARQHADFDDLLGGVEVDLKPAETPANQALTVVRSDIEDDLADLLGPTDTIAPGAVGRPVLVYDPEWRTHFQRNEEGQLKKGLHNVRLIVRNDPRLRGIVARNTFNGEIVMIKEPAKSKRNRDRPKPIYQLEGEIWKLNDSINGDLWSTSHDCDIRAMLQAPESQGGYGIEITDRDLAAAITIAANENRFHPVRDYLEGMVWDGVPRAERLFIDYVGSPDDDYHREAALLWLIGAVTRIYEPGHKFDFVPILEGAQGKRKSTFFMTLARHWFAELEGDFHDKKAMVEQMQGAWIIEMPELQGFSKAEVTTIKGFISRQKDKVRLSYEKRAAEFFRQCIFGGTTNEDEYLRDASGGRRFWPVACMINEIDIARLQANVDQIWAEALVMYRQWRDRHPNAQLPLYMKNESSAMQAKALQESRRQGGADEVVAGQIEDWLSMPIGSELGLDDLDGEEPQYRQSTCLLEIFVEMMGKDKAAYTDRDQLMLSRAMRKVNGWRPSGRRDRFPNGIGQQRSYDRMFPLE